MQDNSWSVALINLSGGCETEIDTFVIGVPDSFQNVVHVCDQGSEVTAWNSTFDKAASGFCDGYRNKPQTQVSRVNGPPKDFIRRQYTKKHPQHKLIAYGAGQLGESYIVLGLELSLLSDRGSNGWPRAIATQVDQ